MLKLFRGPLLLPLLAFFLYLAGSAPFLGQWDSYDYLKQIVSHQLSPLGFGRPAFIGYNILLWESARSLFHLEPMKVEDVILMGTILLGVLGVILFRQLARHFLSPSAAQMAALAFAISPVYAVYSGFIMTEVPMLVALVAAALVLCKGGGRFPVWRDVLGGILFGIAAGIREQSLSMGAAFLWILWSRPSDRVSRFRSLLIFGGAAAAAVSAPVLAFYLQDPPAFIERTRIWFHAIPMGQVQFWNNVQASLLYTFAVCPAAWLMMVVSGVHQLRGNGSREPSPSIAATIRHPGLGVFCSVLLPIMVLWRDADVQIHPRYTLIALPGAIIFCAHLYVRWAGKEKGAFAWAIAHGIVLGAAVVILFPFWREQTGKMENARAIRDAVPGQALIVAGSYSPILDYYRGIGVRPHWQVLWSGWEWKPEPAENSIREAWANQVPVYLSEDPIGWRYFEPEYFHYHFFMRDCRKEPAGPKFFRVHPP